jgi:serine/threonine protein kinase
MPLTIVLTSHKRNVLVDGSGRVRIADFGFAAITQSLDSFGNAMVVRGYSVRWTAPEASKGGMVSQKGDIFSFAMVMVEVRHGRFALSTVLTLCLPGVHRCPSLQYWFKPRCFRVYTATQAPTTTIASHLHRRLMVVDATLLE